MIDTSGANEGAGLDTWKSCEGYIWPIAAALQHSHCTNIARFYKVKFYIEDYNGFEMTTEVNIFGYIDNTCTPVRIQNGWNHKL